MIGTYTVYNIDTYTTQADNTYSRGSEVTAIRIIQKQVSFQCEFIVVNNLFMCTVHIDGPFMYTDRGCSLLNIR